MKNKWLFRMVSFVVITTLCFNLCGSAMALDQSTTTQYQQIVIPLDSESVNEIAIKYQLQDETVKSIYSLLNQQNDNIHIDEITVIIPSNTARGTRTYKGYGNKTYYEETITIKAKSNPGEVGEDYWSNYINSSIDGVINYAANAALNSVTFNTWKIAKIFIPTTFPSTTLVTHYAQLYETKVAKHTYVVEDGQYYFGSLTESTSGYFENTVSEPGVGGGSKKGSNSSITSWMTPNFNSPDQKAYFAYLGSGYTESIDSYDYGDYSFDSVYAQ